MRTAVVVPVVLLAAASLSPAAAAEGQLGVSRDGVHYGDALTRPLFDPEVRWVPGDERTARFWVRNQSSGLGDLTVRIDRAPRDALFGTDDLEVAARIGQQDYVGTTAPGAHELIDAEDVAAGTEVAVDVRVRLAPEAPNATMVLGADLDFTVTLTESTDGDDGGGTPGDGTPDLALPGVDLPATGSSIEPWLLPAAAGLVLGGALLVLLSRRRPPPDA
ncbi:LPXTG cell wall anchor domain-containing protein [Nocardioides dongxiaopingii]|uniref:LPXTG cell wall anchor domain-containing protein n=1 Tax=Nocardioides TaxID=1839 RepID=UPI0010C767AE|nr:MULTISPECIES: LPXTG cell wall anchor domain-containing protein [Nocardioides]QCW50970.1 LPXTG cell wall anchor domain-containing protein [Nocardioides sp. S-1144]